MQAHRKALQSLLSFTPENQAALSTRVASVLEETRGKTSQDVWKSQWELLLKSEILTLAATEGFALKQSETKYYNDLRHCLDLALTFTEHEACDQSFPFLALQDLLETQTVASCSHIFSWIEARASRLRTGIIPSKGKALVLLRTLNDLLRRLSKTGGTTLLCGRILTFLSGVFPLGERSGVNLRGEYGPIWQGTQPLVRERQEQKSDTNDEGRMDVDDAVDSKAKEKAEFYETFWSLQLPFSRPTIFSQAGTLDKFKEAIGKVLPAIKEASAKDRALMGSKTSQSSTAFKRKRLMEQSSGDATLDYFFAKYLTSPELLDLEIADVHFRRQILLQLVILLNHLLSFTKTTKAIWQTQRNRSLHMDDFTLEPADAQWATETLARANEELKNTAPGGRLFAETVSVLTEREKNWVRWKADMCKEFEKGRFRVEIEMEDDQDTTIKPENDEYVGENEATNKQKRKRMVGLEEATKKVRLELSQPPEEWIYRLGSEPLTEIWDMGYRDLSDLQTPFQPGDVKDFVKKVQLEDKRIDMRKKFLIQQAERQAAMRARALAAKMVASPAPAPPPTVAQPESKNPDVEMAAPAPAGSEEDKTGSTRSQANSTIHPSLPAKPGAGSSSAATASAVPASAPVSAPTPTPAPTPAPVPAPVIFSSDSQIVKLEEAKQRWLWLALRVAREEYAHLLKPDISDLAAAIEKEKLDREPGRHEQHESQEREETGVAGPGERPTSPSATLKDEAVLPATPAIELPGGVLGFGSEEVKTEPDAQIAATVPADSDSDAMRS